MAISRQSRRMIRASRIRPMATNAPGCKLGRTVLDEIGTGAFDALLLRRKTAGDDMNRGAQT
jgi:hypothetical protein